MLRQITRSGILAAILLSVVTSIGWSQKPDAGDEKATAAEQQETELTTKVYRVKDLVLPTPDYSFQGVQLPGTESSRGGLRGGGMGMMGGGMGGMGGGGAGASGGGMFNVAPGHVLNQAGGGMSMPPQSFNPRAEFQITMDDLIETITATVEPSTWDDVGGEGSISALGGLLVVQQVPQVHDKMAALLATLRDNGAVPRSITIRAIWLAGEADSILAFNNRSPRDIDSETLASHSDKIVARGQITCFDSQTVHIIAGELRSAVTSYIPVVGQNENSSDSETGLAQSTMKDSKSVAIPTTVLAQTEGATIVPDRGNSVGYQPVTQTVNLGMLLQVTPLLIDDGESVAVDVHSIVVSPLKDPIQVDFKTGLKLDRIDVTAQQFKTTLQMPLNEPKIVSGMTMQPTSREEDRQLILVLEVFAN